MKRFLLTVALIIALVAIICTFPGKAILFLLVLYVAGSLLELVLFIVDFVLGCEDDPDPSNSHPMTANIPAESAKALGLTAPGDEAYIEVTEVNSDGSVVVMAEMEDAEEAAPPPAPAAAAIPPELGKMLGS